MIRLTNSLTREDTTKLLSGGHDGKQQETYSISNAGTATATAYGTATADATATAGITE
jgi:hypothetical protein